MDDSNVDYGKHLTELEKDLDAEIHFSTKTEINTLLETVSNKTGDEIVEYVRRECKCRNESPPARNVKDYANNVLNAPFEQIPRY